MNPMIEVFDGANMSEVVLPPQYHGRSDAGLLAAEQRVHSHRRQEHFAERAFSKLAAGPDKAAGHRLSVSHWPARPSTRSAPSSSVRRGQASRRTLSRLGVVLFNLNEFIYLE